MESFISDIDGVWIKAQFVTHSCPPRCVYLQDTVKDSGLVSSDGGISCIAICKRACFYPTSSDDINYYKGSAVSNCNYRTTVIAEIQSATDDVLDYSRSSFGLPMSRSVLPPQDNYLLFACEQFLDNFGFYNKEVVWVSSIKPLPLNKVIISPTGGNYTDDDITELITQMYNQCQLSLILANTGYQYLHQSDAGICSTPESLADATEDDSSPPWMPNDDCSSDSSIVPPVPYNILETTPTLQGYITTDTTIAVVPYQSPVPRYEVVSSNSSPSGGDSDELFDASSTPPSYLTYSRLRAISASDIQIEDSGQIDMSPFVEDQSISLPTTIPGVPESQSFVIEARLGEGFQLLHHYVILPKAIARKHNIWELQNILISCSSARTNATDPIMRTIITLNNELKHERDESVAIGNATHKRLAIVRLYETADELQTLVPRVLLGHGYNQDDLNVAYLHPELLFNLFTETLSVKRRQYFVSIEVGVVMIMGVVILYYIYYRT